MIQKPPPAEACRGREKPFLPDAGSTSPPRRAKIPSREHFWQVYSRDREKHPLDEPQRDQILRHALEHNPIAPLLEVHKMAAFPPFTPPAATYALGTAPRAVRFRHPVYPSSA